MTPLPGRTERRYADADVTREGAPHKLAEGDWAAALEADMEVVVRRAMEHIVDAELTALLGPRFAWDAARVGYRHGTKVRTVTGPVGAVTVTVPRERLQMPIAGRAEWESQVLPAYASPDAPGQCRAVAGLPLRRQLAPAPRRAPTAAAPTHRSPRGLF